MTREFSKKAIIVSYEVSSEQKIYFHLNLIFMRWIERKNHKIFKNLNHDKDKRVLVNTCSELGK